MTDKGAIKLGIEALKEIKKARGMTIDEAIKIQDAYIYDGAYEGTDEFMEALKLGIEALKAVKDARANNYYTPIAPLPGETKE